MKPIIGIPSDQLIETNPRMPGDYLAYAPHDVKEAIYAAGGIPIILPFPEKFGDVKNDIKGIIEMIDGLMIPGGPDVDPLFYNEEPIPEIGMTLGIKDEFEIALIQEAIKVQKPILGICRGIQVLNVALGGTLYQDLISQNPNVKIQHAQATLGHFKTHHIKIEQNSNLFDLLGEKALVNSRHHQAIKQVAEGLIVAATSPDGVVEAVESEDSDQILAVQWHPENLWQNDKEQFKLFTDFIERSSEKNRGQKMTGDTQKKIIDDLKEQGVDLLEFIYVDYTGLPRGKTVFLSEVAHHLEDGIGITKAMPASTMRDEIVSVYGMNAVGEYRLIPDLKSLRILPYAPTVATLMCNYYDQDNNRLDFDPRVALQKIVNEYSKMGYEIKMTYENEFILYQQAETGELEPYNPEICFSTEAMDNLYRYLPSLIKNLRNVGINPVEYYPEAGAGQHELPISPTDPLTAGDNEILLKRVVKKFFADNNLYATFAPKPNLETASNGAHVHLSLWKNGVNVFYDQQDKLELSKIGYYFVGGILKHMNSLLALTCPSVNSYQRLQPGHWSSAYAIFGKDNREAAVRIPSTFAGDRKNSMNIELKASDATANPYMAFAGILSAGLDGIIKKIMPPAEVDVQPETLTEKQIMKKKIARLPLNLSEALQALKNDSVMINAFSDLGIEVYSKVKQADVDYFSKKTAEEIAMIYRDMY